MSHEDPFKRITLESLVDVFSQGEIEGAESIRNQICEAQAAGCSEEKCKTLLLARDDLNSSVSGELPRLSTLFRFEKALGLAGSLDTQGAASRLVAAVYDLHLANVERSERNEEPVPTVAQSVDHCVQLAERFGLDSEAKVKKVLDGAVLLVEPQSDSPAEVKRAPTEKEATSVSTSTSLVPSSSLQMDEAKALTLGFPNRGALVEFCDEHQLTEQDIPELEYALTKFEVKPRELSIILSEGLSLPDAIHQLRTASEFEITIIETQAEDELSAAQREDLQNHSWAIESWVLGEFMRRFGLDASDPTDDIPELMNALETIMYTLPGTLNDCIKEALHLAARLDIHELERFYEVLPERADFEPGSNPSESLTVPVRRPFKAETSAPEPSQSHRQETPAVANDEDFNDDEFDIPDIG